MVTRVINLLYREVRGLHQAAYVLALFTLASQLLAIVRDRILAHQFGAGLTLDIYYAAFRIPDLLFVLFASVLSVYVLLPFVSRARAEGEAAAQKVLAQFFSLFLVAYSIVACVVFVAAPYIVDRLFPSFSADAMTSVVLLLRILLLQPLFLGISSLYGVVTQMQHRFVLYALSPLLYNIGIIVGILFLYPYIGVAGLAVGVVIGAMGHMMVQWPLVRKTELAFNFVTDIDWSLVRRVVTVALPRAFTLAWGQAQLLVLVILASTMTVGSVAVFQFAYNLQSVPLAIIGMSYSVAAFPVLADLLARSEREKFLSYVTTALRHIMFWAIPIAALVIVLRAQLVRVLLGSGSFNWEDTRLTAAALAMFALALLGQSIALLLVRAFYAGGYTKIPFYVVAAGSCLGVASAYGLLTLYQTLPAFAATITNMLRLYGVNGGEVLMLPLGFVFGVIAEVVLLLIFFARKFTFSLRMLMRPFFTALLAGVVGAEVAYLTLRFIVEGVNQEKFIGIFIQGGVAGLLGLCGVVVTYALLRSPELEEIIKAFRARLFKTDVVAPQPDIL